LHKYAIRYPTGIANNNSKISKKIIMHFPIQEHQWLLKNVRDRYEEREKYLEKIEEDIKHYRNLSPGFDSSEDAIAWLKSE